MRITTINELEKEMNQKVLVAIAVTALILGILNLVILLLPPQSNPINAVQKVPLDISNIAIRNSTDVYSIMLQVYLTDETPTLYNCNVQVEYLTVDNTWKTLSKNIGIVNFEDNVELTFNLDAEFAYEFAPLDPMVPWLRYDGVNINAEAYGYLTP